MRLVYLFRSSRFFPRWRTLRLLFTLSTRIVALYQTALFSSGPEMKYSERLFLRGASPVLGVVAERSVSRKGAEREALKRPLYLSAHTFFCTFSNIRSITEKVTSAAINHSVLHEIAVDNACSAPCSVLSFDLTPT